MLALSNRNLTDKSHFAKTCKKHQILLQFQTKFLWRLLNKCMNKYKNFKDNALTEDWLRDNGIAIKSFNATNVKLLQAQQKAHELLTQHKHLLTQNQIKTLKAFQRKMVGKHTRNKLKPESAYPILNISTKIHRQIHQINN